MNVLCRFWEGGSPAQGVVAFSSGNHAQGVVIAAAELGIPAAIVMPTDNALDEVLLVSNADIFLEAM